MTDADRFTAAHALVGTLRSTLEDLERLLIDLETVEPAPAGDEAGRADIASAAS